MSNQNQDPTDENLQILQEREIQDEIAQNFLLIGPREPMESLMMEYKDDLHVRKVKDLITKYSGIRRVRPDGNCFFRGFSFAYFEYLLSNREEYTRIVDAVESSREKLLGLGYPEFTLLDIYEGFTEILSLVSKGESASNELFNMLNVQAHSDYVVSFFRLVVSVHLREREDFYQNFMEDGVPVSEFCKKEVEPMNKESDHIHITALSTALEIGIRVRYMDRSYQVGANAHDFPESLSRPIVHLLYRPGHYDVLYPKQNP